MPLWVSIGVSTVGLAYLDRGGWMLNLLLSKVCHTPDAALVLRQIQIPAAQIHAFAVAVASAMAVGRHLGCNQTGFKVIPTLFAALMSLSCCFLSLLG